MFRAKMTNEFKSLLIRSVKSFLQMKNQTRIYIAGNSRKCDFSGQDLHSATSTCAELHDRRSRTQLLRLESTQG